VGLPEDQTRGGTSLLSPELPSSLCLRGGIGPGWWGACLHVPCYPFPWGAASPRCALAPRLWCCHTAEQWVLFPASDTGLSEVR